MTGCATLANSYRQVAEGHSEEADVRRICEQFAGQCDHHGERARDQELIRTVEDCDKEMESQQQWLTTRMKAAAPQALLVAD